MEHRKHTKRWMMAAAFLVLGGWFCWGAGEAISAEPDLSYFRQAKINWRQFEGQKLTIGLNKHP